MRTASQRVTMFTTSNSLMSEIPPPHRPRRMDTLPHLLPADVQIRGFFQSAYSFRRYSLTPAVRWGKYTHLSLFDDLPVSARSSDRVLEASARSYSPYAYVESHSQHSSGLPCAEHHFRLHPTDVVWSRSTRWSRLASYPINAPVTGLFASPPTTKSGGEGRGDA